MDEVVGLVSGNVSLTGVLQDDSDAGALHIGESGGDLQLLQLGLEGLAARLARGGLLPVELQLTLELLHLVSQAVLLIHHLVVEVLKGFQAAGVGGVGRPRQLDAAQLGRQQEAHHHAYHHNGQLPLILHLSSHWHRSLLVFRPPPRAAG